MSKEIPREKDDLEAVRILASTLKDFNKEEQERIIRWASEKLGLSFSVQAPFAPHAKPAEKVMMVQSQPHQTRHATPDIKTFVEEKNPTTDTHFATSVAYYYRFEAPEAEQKDSISQDDLKEACRQADRKRIKFPRQTLNNAYKDGLLDKASEKGKYMINTVGENLVAMTLPGGAAEKSAPRKRAPKKATKKAALKKAEKRKNIKRK